MEDKDYLSLFQKIQNSEQIEKQKYLENLNKNNELQRLNETPIYNDYPKINETPDVSQYNIRENLNDGWGTEQFQVETRVNGVVQRNNNQQPSQPIRRRNRPDPNGLNAFLDEDNLNEVVRYSTPAPAVVQPTQPPTEVINTNLKDADVVTIEMFNKVNESAMLTLAGNRLQNVDIRKVQDLPENQRVIIKMINS